MPLTAEEKKIRKAEKKAQKLKEAAEMRIKIRKDELGREVQTSQGNMAAYMKQWYLRNYAARFPHIVQDMEVAWHSFEHTLDVKDFIIFELMDKMDEARIQEAMSWQDFSIKIDNLICDFQTRVNKVEGVYQGQLAVMMDKALHSTVAERKSQTDLEDYYKTILFIMEEQFSESMTTVQGEYMTKRDEEVKKGVHSIEVMSAALEKTLKMTVADIKDTLQVYKDTTEARRKEVEALRLKDDYYTDMIKRQDARMAKLSEELNSLQGQVSEKHESRMVLEDLKKDREETYAEYMEVRAGLTKDATLDNNQLLTLTTDSNNIIRDLERIMNKGEKILRLGALCRKLETQEEKVLPFGAQIELKSEEKKGEESSSPFALFWRRYANANLIKQKLKITLEALYKENEKLKECLDTTFEIMSLTQV